MTSGQFAPLLPVVAQVAGIEINKWKLLEDDLKRYISLQNYDSEFVKQISDYIIYMWLRHLCHYWQKWRKLTTSHNSSGNSVNA